MKINTSYNNYFYNAPRFGVLKTEAHKNTALIGNGLTFGGLQTEGVREEILEKVFQEKMEEYGIIADAKSLDVEVSDENGVIKVQVSDTRTGDKLKELVTQNPDSDNFKYAFARTILLANAPDNVIAGNAVFKKYADKLPVDIPEDKYGNIEYAYNTLKAELEKGSQYLDILEQNLTTSDNPDYIAYLKGTNIDYIKTEEKLAKLRSAFDMVSFAREYTEEGRSYATNPSWRALLETVQL